MLIFEMNRKALLFAAFVLPLAAQQEDVIRAGGANRDRDFSAWMKTTAAANGVLQKSESKTGKDVYQKAETLGSIYESMIGFWRQRGAADAVKISVQGKVAAIEMANAARANDGAAAAAAYAKLSATCKSCHDVHRMKLADGTYLIQTAVPKLR